MVPMPSTTQQLRDICQKERGGLTIISVKTPSIRISIEGGYEVVLDHRVFDDRRSASVLALERLLRTSMDYPTWTLRLLPYPVIVATRAPIESKRF